jgi:hypothetical protein
MIENINNNNTIEISNNFINHNNNTMSKAVKSHLIYLKRLGRNGSNEEDKTKIERLINLYGDRKISQVTTAEKMIIALVKADTPRKQRAVNKKYDKLIDKYNDMAPLSVRVAETKIKRKWPQEK